MNEEEENNNDNNDNNHKIHDNNNNNNIVVVVDVKALEERVTKKLEQLIVRIRNVENDKRDAKESYEEKQMELNQLETMTIEKRRVKALMKRAALKLLKTRSSLNRIMIEDIYNDNHKDDDDNDDNDIDNDIDNEEESGDEEMIFFRNEKVRLIEEAKSYRDEYDEKDIEVKKLRNTMNDIITLINNCKHSLETTNDDDVVERRRNNNNDTPGNNSSKTATATATAPATSPTMVKV